MELVEANRNWLNYSLISEYMWIGEEYKVIMCGISKSIPWTYGETLFRHIFYSEYKFELFKDNNDGTAWFEVRGRKFKFPWSQMRLTKPFNCQGKKYLGKV